MLTDLTFKPVVDQLLACYCQQLQLVSTPIPPGNCCIRPGAEVAYGISLTQDECCAGLGWVRVVRWGAGFPTAPEEITNCLPDQWRLELELGAVRCAPTGSAEVLPTCAEWTSAYNVMMEDAVAMRRAVVCCFADPANPDDERLISFGEWEPFGPEGMCVGGTLTVTVQVIACNECD